MSTRKVIIHIGLADPPNTPQFSMTEEELHAAVQSGADKASTMGFDVTTKYIRCSEVENNPSKVLDDFREQLQRLQPFGFIIGGGVKMKAEYTVFFESLVDLIRVESPSCRLGFQSRPDDIDVVCERCFQSPTKPATQPTTKSTNKTVVHIGLGDAPPGFNMTDEQIREAVKSGADKAQGFDISLTFIMSADIQSDLPKVLDQIRAKLHRLQPFGVIVGGGVKMNPALTPFFEQVINISRSESPSSRFGFQSKPDDIWTVCERFDQ